MSEPTPEATPTALTPTPVPTPPAEPKPDDAAPTKSFTQDDVNALLAKQKREQFGDYGDLKAKAEKFDQVTQEQMTEAQKIAERATAAERERDDAKAEGLRYKAAATHGIGEDYFDLLGSGSEEAIASRAERVGGLLRENTQMKAELEALRAGKPAPSNGRPVEALKPGATPENAQTQDDVDYAALFGVNG